MKLLIVTQTVDDNDQLLGFFVEWIRRFAGQFERVTVLCLNRGSFSLPNNVKVHSLGKESGSGKLKQLITFYNLLFTYRIEYDAVLVHMNPIWVVLGGIPWRMLSKKIYLWYTHKSVTWKLRLAEYLANKIFTASAESFRLPSGKVIVTGHGIDTELFKPHNPLPATHNPIRILSVGRIAPVKNYGTLIDALKILMDKGEDFHLTMVGEAPLESDKEYEINLKTKIRELGLDDKITFTGKVIHRDLPGYYSSHDLFIHLSRTGSLDKSILEAMAGGMRVLSSNDASKSFLSPELIFNENNPHELAGKIWAGEPVSPKLREYVVTNHNLERLILILSNNIRAR